MGVPEDKLVAPTSHQTDLAESDRLIQQLLTALRSQSPAPSATQSHARFIDEGYPSSTRLVEDPVAPQPRHTLRWVGGVVTVVGSLVGSLYAWSGSLVTQDTLDNDIAPIEQKVNDTHERLDKVQKGVDRLLERSDRQDRINEARRLAEKHQRAYKTSFDDWSASRKKGPKPGKSPELLAAEAKLEHLLED